VSPLPVHSHGAGGITVDGHQTTATVGGGKDQTIVYDLDATV
jgi:hypothetical protein